MKVLSILAVALGIVAANAEHVERQPILGGSEVPSGTKAYTTGIRSTADGNSFCIGALITPTHVLTTATCTGSFGEPTFVTVGTHYINSSKDGEQIKVVSTVNHTLHNSKNASHNFAVVTLEKPSKVAQFTFLRRTTPTSSRACGPRSRAGVTRATRTALALTNSWMWVWRCGTTTIALSFSILTTHWCVLVASLERTRVGDTGAPLIKEKGKGDADDILIGLSSFGYDCGDKGVPGVYSRVSTGVEWINSVIKKQ